MRFRLGKLLAVGGLAFFGASAASTSEKPLGKEIIGTEPGTWRSATVFTHVIWRDLLFYGGGSGSGGGDPRHEMEIGVFHLAEPDKGRQHSGNPVVTRAQFGLDKPGRGITPLTMVEREGRLYLFCTSRPHNDLQPRIVVIEASVDDPYQWSNYTVVIGPELTGLENHHGASVLADPESPDQWLVFFAARTAPAEYRVLLARVSGDQIMNPDAYRLIRDFDNPVLSRGDAKANYPFARYDSERSEYELWYSGQSIGNSATRSSFVTRATRPEQFQPAGEAILDPSGDPMRNDCDYATGPMVHDGYLYYSGRRSSRGDYRGIFCVPLSKLGSQ